ncbi:pseudouridine synthase [Raineyella fluvialis]|uniref:RNA pseudouridylate synthase n=1 Tax=Raineyella fluvialis TaxID=2662261 RepID=A0A5Q2F8F0_9ACTN|nr:pseudouridine synthase [Raineyella fluvialis]QGF22938.1 pseudouridylate synthase [Raineyella fluvialis]
MRDFLRDRLAAQAPVDAMLGAGRFVDGTGAPFSGKEPYAPHTFVWFHRDLREEPVVPFEVTVLHRDERIVVVDKPHFLSSIPRGRHITQSVVVRMRSALGLPELSPAHRLDRLTAGVLLLTTERRWRAPYQQVFEHRLARKTYTAVAPVRSDLVFPLEVSNHLHKRRGILQGEVLADRAANSHTTIELLETRGTYGLYRLTPTTGKTHQLRLHLNGLGIPIVGDPLYPEVLDVDIDDFSAPLELVARTLSFTDPVTGEERTFHSKIGHRWEPVRD